MLLAALLLVAACANDTANRAQSGTLTLTLTAGGVNDGALVLIVSGAPITSVDAPAGYQIASNADGQGTHIMVMGNIATGVIATISVPDVARASAYAVTVVQAADRTSFSLLDAAHYHVTVSP